VTSETIYPNSQRLIAAGGAEIEVMGEVRVDIELESDFIINTHALVSRYVDEPMLGLDWLTTQNVEWKFGQRSVTIQGRTFKLFGANPTWRIRRVILQEEATIPAHMQVSVKARTVYARLARQPSTWATESTEVRPGVRVPRTLIPDTPKDLLLPIANITDEEVVLGVGTPLAPLEEVRVETAERESNSHNEYQHLRPLWSTMGAALPDADKGRVDALLKEFSSVFSKGENDLGCATAVKHRIDTGDARPFGSRCAVGQLRYKLKLTGSYAKWRSKA